MLQTEPKKAPAKSRAKKEPAAPKAKRTKPLEQIQAEGHGVTLSLTEICEEFGRDWETIKKRLHEIDIRPTGKRNGFPVYRLKDLLRIERTDEQGNTDPSKMRPAEQSAYYRAQRDRMELEKELRVLYRREDIEAELREVFRIVNYELDTLVDELERDVQPPPIVLARIEDKLVQLRERMFQAIARGKTTSQSSQPSPAPEIGSWDAGP